MSNFKIDNRTLRLLGAQVNLSETFTHVLRSTPQREALPFCLKVDRSKIDTAFTIEMGSNRHSLVLQNDKRMHLKLADFIEEIANGPFDSCPLQAMRVRHAERQFGVFDVDQRQKVFELVCTGGTLSLDLGFELPIEVAIHRSGLRSNITAIVSIGIKQPRTKCFTACGTTVEMYEKVSESIHRIAAAATPAAHAA